MNKFFLSIAFLITTTHALSNDAVSSPTTLTPVERDRLRALYTVAAMIPLFEKEGDIDFDYFLDVLEKHVKIIEHKIRTKKSGWSSKSLKISLAVTGILTTGLSCLTYPIWHSLSTGKFYNATIPYSMIAQLPSLKFTRSEKKKLDLIDVKKITILCENIYEQYFWKSEINALSPSAAKNLEYLARKTALNQAKTLIGAAAVLLLLVVATIAYPQIYKALYYTEHLAKRLEGDRHLSKLLREERNNRRLLAIRALRNP